MKKTAGSETTYYFYGVGGLLCEFTTTNTGATQASNTNPVTYRTSDRLGTAVLLIPHPAQWWKTIGYCRMGNYGYWIQVR